ncbi:MAG: CRTAC1 family protein [Planctomycetota bacterium]|nr:MAG: CRTAC1 family protein [Planctomycetota bacterium]
MAATSDELASAEKMRAYIAALAVHVAGDFPFLGSAQITQLEAALAKGGADPLQEAQLRYSLGTNLLRVGRTEDSLRELEACHALLAQHAGGVRPAFEPRLEYEIGVACMRLAENRNCIANCNGDSCVFPIRGGGVHVDRAASERAVGWFERALATSKPGSVEHNSALWLLNVAQMTLDAWPDAVPVPLRLPERAIRPPSDFPRFPDVANATGVAGFNLAGGAAAEDYDGDGWTDLVISDWDPRSELHYYRNRGDGTFEDRTKGSGLEGLSGALNIAQADYDGDGRTDLFLPRGAWWNEHGKIQPSLIRNLGGGHWVDVSYAAGIAEPGYPSQTGAFADYDLDGDLDLFKGNEGSPVNPAPSQLFRNRGDGTFEDVAAAAGVVNNRYAKGAVWGDFDGDRHPDLYVSNLGGFNRLYRNRGDGTFEDIATKLKVAGPIDSFAAWFWDYDNDGALDLYVTTYKQADYYRLAPVVASVLGLPHDAESAALYRNDGKGGFENRASAAGLSPIALPMGANFGELDNDGYPDFYLGTGYPGYDGLVPNVMFRNRGGQTFEDVSAAGGFGNLQKGHGVLFADFDNDGDQDVFEEVGGAFPGDGFRNLLFSNPGFDGHWLRVTVRGVQSNRGGIGTRIKATIAERGAQRAIYRTVGTGGSFGANPLTQHLGLGDAKSLETLEVYWPKTNTTQTFRGVPLDAHVEITEGDPTWRLVREGRTKLREDEQ